MEIRDKEKDHWTDSQIKDTYTCTLDVTLSSICSSFPGKWSHAWKMEDLRLIEQGSVLANGKIFWILRQVIWHIDMLRRKLFLLLSNSYSQGSEKRLRWCPYSSRASEVPHESSLW